MKLSFVWATVLAAGCGASIQATTINAAPHPMAPRAVGSVELFTSGPPARPHVDVALLEVEESSSVSTASTPDMLNGLRERGAQMGCDAIVISGSSSRDPGLADTETWLSSHPKGRKGFTATCIAYTFDPTQASSQRPGAPPDGPAIDRPQISTIPQ